MASSMDLDSALELVRTTRLEKENLRAEVEELRTSFLQATQENGSLRVQLSEAQDVIKNQQVEHNHLVSEWERQLDAAQADVAALQGKVLTQEDIETMRAKVLAEVDGPHQEYCAELEAEVDKFRDLYHKARRDHEMLREQQVHRAQSTEQFQAEMDKLRQAEVDELRSQLDELKAAETESRLHDEMRKVKRDLTTAELRVMTLTAEVDELQANKERSTREFDQAMRVSDRTNHDLSANLKALTSELDSTKLHVHRLQEELTVSHGHLNDAKTKLHDAEKRIISLQSEKEEVAHGLRTELADTRVKHLHDKGQWDREAAVLRESAATLERQVKLADRQVEEMTAELTQKDEDCGTRIHEVREAEWAKQRTLEADKIELEARLRALEREAAARSEKTAARVVELEAMLASEKEQTEAAGADRRRLTLELEKVERTLSENQPRLAAAEAQQEEFTQLKATATQRERELANAQKEQATLESRLAAKETALAQVQCEMDDMRVRLRKEADELRVSYTEAVQSFEGKENAAAEDARELFRRFEALAASFKAYKKRSRAERQHLTELNAGLEQQLDAATEARRELESQNRRAQGQLHDLQARVNEYKHVVNSEGLRGGAGVGHTTHTVPSAFAEDIARENREKIERLKEAVNERMIAHATLFSDDVGN
eukprot:m.439647 g.439647  ORF g.439647 m.439647 type:complete len:662 (+) comp18406_c0_seq1:164-2149(+)